MEKIKINNSGSEYDIKSIRSISGNVIQIVFANARPKAFGDITVFTRGGLEATTLVGFETIYRDEGEIVYLSNDGSVYKALETSAGEALPEEPYVPTNEEIFAHAKYSKRVEVNSACEAAIVSGINVVMSDGTVEHFDLKDRDQMNLFAKQVQLAQGVELIEYHSDTDPVTNCKYYSNADMQKIIEQALFHVSYHQTYCISLKVWLDACQTADEVNDIFYGADIPEEYQSDVLKAYIEEIRKLVEVSADETVS